MTHILVARSYTNTPTAADKPHGHVREGGADNSPIQGCPMCGRPVKKVSQTRDDATRTLATHLSREGERNTGGSLNSSEETSQTTSWHRTRSAAGRRLTVGVVVS
jgi:hypothetical protein